MKNRYRFSWYERRTIEVPRHPLIKWLFGPKYISPYVRHSWIFTGITVHKGEFTAQPEAVSQPYRWCGTSLTWEPVGPLPHCEGDGSFIENPSFEDVDGGIWDGWKVEL